MLISLFCYLYFFRSWCVLIILTLDPVILVLMLVLIVNLTQCSSIKGYGRRKIVFLAFTLIGKFNCIAAADSFTDIRMSFFGLPPWEEHQWFFRNLFQALALDWKCQGTWMSNYWFLDLHGRREPLKDYSIHIMKDNSVSMVTGVSPSS